VIVVAHNTARVRRVTTSIGALAERYRTEEI
jgi:hypothetical protein